MNNFSIIFPIISAIFIFGLIVFLLLKKPESLLSWLMVGQLSGAEIWLIGTVKMFQNVNNYDLVEYWDRVVYIGVILYAPLILHFTVEYIGLRKKYLWLTTLSDILAIIFLLLSRTSLFVSGVFVYTWGVHTQAQLAHHFFLVYFLGIAAVSWLLLFQLFKEQINVIERERTKYLLFALMSMVLISGVGFLPAYNVPIYPIPFFSGVAFTGLIVYAITRYRLMSLKLVIQRSAIYFLSIFIVTAVLAAVMFALRYLDVNRDYILIALLLAILILLVQPIQHVVNRLFLKPEYDLSKKLRQHPLRPDTRIIQGMSPLYSKLQHELPISYYQVFTINPGHLQRGVYEAQFPANQPDNKFPLSINTQNYLRITQSILLRSELGQFEDICNIMKAKHAQILIPVNVEGDLLGLIFIGLEHAANLKEILEQLNPQREILVTTVAMGLRLDYYVTPAEEEV